MSSDSSYQANEIRSPIIASWVLLLATCLLALIPLIGFLTWVIGGVTITIAIVLGIVVISKGGTWNGIFILLASLIVVPCVIIVAPVLSTLIAGAALDERTPSGDSVPLIQTSTEPDEAGTDEAIIETEEAPPDSTGEAKDVSEEAVKGSDEAAPVPGTSSLIPPG